MGIVYQKDASAEKQAQSAKLYPVGSIYMSVIDTNPALLFGGTWEQIQGRFLLAASTGYPNGSTGGEATTSIQIADGSYNGLTTGGAWNNRVLVSPYASRASYTNMPPYLAVYMWRRVG